MDYKSEPCGEAQETVEDGHYGILAYASGKAERRHTGKEETLKTYHRGLAPVIGFLSMSLLELRAQMGTRGQENGAGQTSE